VKCANFAAPIHAHRTYYFTLSLSSEKQFYLGNDRNQKHTQFQPIGNFIVYGCSASVIAAWRGFFSSHVGSFWPVTALAIFRVDSPITVIAVGWLGYVS